MMKAIGEKFSIICWCLLIVFSPGLHANSEVDELRKEVACLREELKLVKDLLKETLKKDINSVEKVQFLAKNDEPSKKSNLAEKKKKGVADKKEEKVLAIPQDTGYLAAPQKLVANLQQDMAKLSEKLKRWTSADSNFSINGYMDAGFKKEDHHAGTFDFGHFNPTFLFNYRDLVLASAEVEFEIDDEGHTETKLEYANVNLFVNDNITLTAGKFLTPLGFFARNLHSSWINKLPTKPAGFKSGQASPESNIGVEASGEFLLFCNRVNYAMFASNAPKAILTEEETSIEKIESTPPNKDSKGRKLVGGRLGFFPLSGLEVGASAAVGKARIFTHDERTLVTSNTYFSYAGDFNYRWKGVTLRGEYIEQGINSSRAHTIPKGRWRGWYIQPSYRFDHSNWEPVFRYAQLRSTQRNQNQVQCAFGLDYWFTPSLVGKAAYEINSGHKNTSANDNAFVLQIAYGF
ncbi:MAG: hypothetical protein A2X70_02820 [Alphaproteobacteria bacterium GWC2_42_16]|nr:MAG: hypothetical protein A2X70_02820 [Alphaproteobacteria bacterium GWC2_42_16]OFW73867.1 MAG: hypothetical protein A2Z80_03380 [Alphaproteobacteria bacterium GWA2_41_27]OFW82723.1 MAG: hypothetical protein A3E50_01075 [Alphaproteobacteria bacterium RIFCSPHIGHO2_12_FULL_42_100]OFW86538.1 MAG: hypothetical protein A2W06_07430 [Alphaproteobacteria bacterium RBG_16_42_14]OFW91877.1 MAG: hypothetical protein A3C41_03840 [Alphaproteobacteria bacterium RIFCSPHIGHO2_02_FULL_42_30]OFW93824.1 MAG: 